MITAGILTVSDKGSRGQREDLSGPVIREVLEQAGISVTSYRVIPDEKEDIRAVLREWADSGTMDVIMTTGGTGLARRDVTPEATLDVIDREVPGFTEAMRAKSLEKTPMAVLSRAVAGLRKDCLIINMPGSPKAVRECLEVVMPSVPHAVEIIKGVVTEHTVTSK